MIMKRKRIGSFLSGITVVALIVGFGFREEIWSSEAGNTIRIYWVFRSISIADEPYTRVSLALQGKRVRIVPIGRFYGTVVKEALSSNDEQNWLPEGAIMGCMTFHAGAGHELSVWFDASKRIILIKGKSVEEMSGSSALRILHRIKISGSGVIPLQSKWE